MILVTLVPMYVTIIPPKCSRSISLIASFDSHRYDRGFIEVTEKSSKKKKDDTASHGLQKTPAKPEDFHI
jgi:hypothetical protein